jgi:hypothetical protein
MNVSLLHENEDGSACYSFDLTDEERKALIRYGIMEALKASIRQGEKMTCEGADIDLEEGKSES